MLGKAENLGVVGLIPAVEGEEDMVAEGVGALIPPRVREAGSLSMWVQGVCQ